ncbi:MAG: hypothetical protein Q8R28_11340 [Dehalococcoidia bacterium]|nr:hypothetical protein [Dehalococcoidia bacterium]
MVMFYSPRRGAEYYPLSEVGRDDGHSQVTITSDAVHWEVSLDGKPAVADLFYENDKPFVRIRTLDMSAQADYAEQAFLRLLIAKGAHAFRTR